MPEAGTRLYAAVLGPLQLRAGGRAGPLLAVTPGRRQRLLAVLLLAGGRVVSVDRLVAELWEDPPEDARAALHTTVARLRRALGPAADAVQRSSPGYALDAAAMTRDAEEFTRLRADARSASPPEAVRLLEAALALWRGPAWAEFADELARTEAARLEEERLQAVEERASALIAAGRSADAVPALVELVTAEPLRERAVELLMAAQHASGSVADALAAYGRYRTGLAAELGLDPSPGLARRYAELLRHDHADRAPRPAARLPVRSSLVGRADQQAALTRTLHPGRLVTLVGPGGVGKTALAQAVAAAAADPVWWVDLAALGDGAGVLPAALAAVGVEVHPGSDPAAALRRWAQQADGLLVLDNCEHLLGPVGELAESLAAPRSRLRLLATSRERLGLPAEQVLPLPPLRLPAVDGPEAHRADGEAPAVQLFLARARAVAPDLPEDQHTLRSVGEVCRRLDGLPLAIELAASRVGTVSLPDLAARIDSRFRLLRRSRGALRHQTLSAAIDWSYDLLSPAERAAFAALSVFPASFELAAAETVLASPEIEADDVADLVGRLVDRSLLVGPEPSGVGRYRMLETLRAYAADRLPPTDRALVARRHAAWVAATIAQSVTGLLGPAEADWSDRLHRLLPDVHRALTTALDDGDAELAGRLLAPLHRWAYFRLRGDVLGWAARALALPGPPDPGLLAMASAAAWQAGRLPAAVEQARRALELADPRAPIAVIASDALGDAALGQGDLDRAASAYLRAATLGSELGCPDDASLGFTGHALTLVYAGRDATGALEQARQAAARPGVSATTRAMARYLDGEALAEQDADAALRALAEARRLAASVGSTLVVGVAATAATALLSRRGSLTAATYAAFVEAIDHWLSSGNDGLFLTCLRNLVPLLSRAGAHAAVLELAASLVADPADHPSYGSEAERLTTAVTTARERLGAAATRHHEEVGAERSTPAAARAAQQVLRGLALAAEGSEAAGPSPAAGGRGSPTMTR